MIHNDAESLRISGMFKVFRTRNVIIDGFSFSRKVLGTK